MIYTAKNVKQRRAIIERFERAFAFAQKQVRRLTDDHPEIFPMYTVNGRWIHEGELWTNWCEGFLGEMMWIFTARLGDSTAGAMWRKRAEHYSRLIEERKATGTSTIWGFSSGRRIKGGTI